MLLFCFLHLSFFLLIKIGVRDIATERRIHSIEFSCLITFIRTVFVKTWLFFTYKVKFKAFWQYVWKVTHVFFRGPWNEKPRKMANEEGFPSVSTID